MSMPCPACGFLTILDESFGSYNICDVCGWEDDGVQLANPACGGGANKESLIEAQAAALQRYPLTQVEVAGFCRDNSWRPLSSAEIAAAKQEYSEKVWKNRAVFGLADTYWRKNSSP